MREILVVGGGPAGLAAAEALAASGEVRVRLRTLECILGGNAMAHTTPDGRVVEQGQHIMSGFYREMRALLRRSGVDPEATTISGEGRVIAWEDRDQRAHELHLGPSSPGTLAAGLAYSGFTWSEKLGFSLFLARVLPSLLRGVPERWDDECLTAWCLQRGMPGSVATTHLFRASREAQFNWPGEISAYSVLQTLREMGRDFTSSEVRFPAGSMSDIWWEPIARRIEALGGVIERDWKLTGLRLDGGRLAGLRFDKPVPHDPAECFFDASLPMRSDATEWLDGFDAAILAIPAGALQQLLTPAQLAQSGLHGVPRLRTAAPMGLHVWHRHAVTHGPRTLVLGMAPPLGVVLDNKPLNPAYRDNPEYGAVLHFVGQETGFEDTPDEELLRAALASVRRVPGYEGMTEEGVIAWQMMRERAPHRRYWLSEPGSLRDKPWPRTAVEGLWLAGDWVRSEADFPCMETAIRSGRTVAQAVLGERAALRAVTPR